MDKMWSKKTIGGIHAIREREEDKREYREYIINQQQKKIDQLNNEIQQKHREIAKAQKNNRTVLRILIRSGAFFIPNISVDVEPWLDENIPIEGPPLQ